jgi:threonine dehydratase
MTATAAPAAARRMTGRFTGKRIGVLLSGGNMDLDQYATLLAQ